MLTSEEQELFIALKNLLIPPINETLSQIPNVETNNFFRSKLSFITALLNSKHPKIKKILLENQDQFTDAVDLTLIKIHNGENDTSLIDPLLRKFIGVIIEMQNSGDEVDFIIKIQNSGDEVDLEELGDLAQYNEYIITFPPQNLSSSADAAEHDTTIYNILSPHNLSSSADAAEHGPYITTSFVYHNGSNGAASADASFACPEEVCGNEANAKQDIA